MNTEIDLRFGHTASKHVFSINQQKKLIHIIFNAFGRILMAETLVIENIG